MTNGASKRIIRVEYSEHDNGREGFVVSLAREDGQQEPALLLTDLMMAIGGVGGYYLDVRWTAAHVFMRYLVEDRYNKGAAELEEVMREWESMASGEDHKLPEAIKALAAAIEARAQRSNEHEA